MDSVRLAQAEGENDRYRGRAGQFQPIVVAESRRPYQRHAVWIATRGGLKDGAFGAELGPLSQVHRVPKRAGIGGADSALDASTVLEHEFGGVGVQLLAEAVLKAQVHFDEDVAGLRLLEFIARLEVEDQG
jgi:hypothetical protein